jgi:hypothetical protein
MLEMKTSRILFMLIYTLLAGCGTKEFITNYDIIKNIETSNHGNPSAIADKLTPHFQNCKNPKTPAYSEHDCELYIQSIALALFDAHRYPEASDLIINKLFPLRPTPENYAMSFLSYASETVAFEKRHKAISNLYYALKSSNDPRAKDWVITAFLFQDDFRELPTVMTDSEFLADVSRLLGSSAHREAEFYVKNIKNKINETLVSNAKSARDNNQILTDSVALSKFAYDYAAKNKLSEPYLQYLSYKLKFGEQVIQDEY